MRSVLVLAPAVLALLCAGCQPPSTVPDGGAAFPDAGNADGGGGPLAQLLAGTPATGFADGVGTAARFNGPSGGAILPDGSAILLSDTFNAVLRRVDLSNGAVTTVAGRVQVQATADGVGTAARFQGPRGMAVNASGTVAYVADGPAIRRVDLSTWTVTTIAGTPGEDGFQDGTGAAVRLGYLLHALELSADSEVLYIADRSNRVLRALTLSSGELVTVAGWPYTGASRSVDGVGTAARFSGLGGMARVGDALYVADTFNHTVRRVSLSDFSVTTVAGAAGVAGEVDGAGTAARFDAPQGLAVAG